MKQSASHSKSSNAPLMIISDGSPPSNLKDLTQNIPPELKAFLSQFQSGDGQKIFNSFEGGLMGLLKTLSGFRGLPLLQPQSKEDHEKPIYVDGLSSKTILEKSQDHSTDTPSLQPRVSPASIPLDPLRASRVGDCLRTIFFVIALLILVLFLGWDWGVEALGKLRVFNPL